MVLVSEGRTLFSMTFSTNVLTVREEEYVYPLDSFLAEFGGALGLFLGFSMYDYISSLVDAILKRTKFI